jgi:hypothetical protein
MANHIATLEMAREQMVEARRDLAEKLSKADNSIYRSSLIAVQNAIDAIDKALTDEKKIDREDVPVNSFDRKYLHVGVEQSGQPRLRVSPGVNPLSFARE